MLAHRLLSPNIADPEKVSQIISFLCSDSGSHDYPIFRREARLQLGLNIETPSMELYGLIKRVYDDIASELELGKPFVPAVTLANQHTATYTVRRCLIESIDGGTDVYLSEGQLIKNQAPVPQPNGMPPIVRTAIEDQRNFEGWRHEEPPTP